MAASDPKPVPSPIAFNPRQVFAGLGLGVAGGAGFALLGLPLAWMMGAMTVTTLATIAGAKLSVPPGLRTGMIVVIGVLLGSAFSPALAAALPGWLGAIVALAVHVVLLSAGSFLFLSRVARFDPVTAYFCAAPGGLMEMTIQAERYGGDVRRISLVHATRILVIVATVPVYFRVIRGLDVPSIPPTFGADAFSVAEVLILIACGVGGYVLGRLVRLPTPALIGPMLLSAAVHLTGYSHIAPPSPLIAAAQVIIGIGIGCRFTGLTLADLRSTITFGAGSALIMIALATLMTALAAPLLGLRTEALLLSLVPGGLTEMSLIALSLGIETAFISAMHILRLMMVIVGAPLAFGLLKRLGGVDAPRKP